MQPVAAAAASASAAAASAAASELICLGFCQICRASWRVLWFILNLLGLLIIRQSRTALDRDVTLSLSLWNHAGILNFAHGIH